jgi:hypothetical protein
MSYLVDTQLEPECVYIVRQATNTAGESNWICLESGHYI